MLFKSTAQWHANHLIASEAALFEWDQIMIEKGRLFKITKERICFFLFFASMFVLTEIGRGIYRPYIYANHLFDFWIADTIGNLTGTITIVFFELALINPTHKAGRIVVAGITLGLIAYEFAQYFSPRSVLDWRDIIATLIGGMISLGIYELLGLAERRTAPLGHAP